MMPATAKLPTALADEMKAKKIWQPACPVAIERLALVTIKYIDFDGTVHEDGELIVHDAAAPRVARIFARLFDIKFPIAKIRSLHHYDGDDDRSMADNNSSSFNFRPIAGSQTVSMHGYGLAIDINPLQNPYVIFDEENGIANIHPPDAWQFLNRINQKPGMIEPIVSVFEENGFVVWGGKWTTPIDYHHFQSPRAVANLLSAMNREDGTRLFELFAEHQKLLPDLLTRETTSELLSLYQSDPNDLFDKLEKLANN